MKVNGSDIEMVKNFIYLGSKMERALVSLIAILLRLLRPLVV